MSPIIDRRKFLLSLPGVAVVPGILTRMGRRALSARALNHATVSVSDPERSVKFYQGLFGMPIQARQGETTVLRLGDGPHFMAIQPVAGGQAPSISRLGIAVDDFDVDRIIETLAAAGVRRAGAGMPAEKAMRVWTERRGAGAGGGPDGTRELYLGDPHGIVVQIVDATHCGGAEALGSACGALEPSPAAGLLALRDLNHFTIGVPNPQRSNEFYRDVFGLPVQVFQAATPALEVGGGGQFLMFSGGAAAPPGAINHVCFTLEGFDTEEILGTLSDYGIRSRVEGESNVVPLRSYISMRMPNRGGCRGRHAGAVFYRPGWASHSAPGHDLLRGRWTAGRHLQLAVCV